MTPNRDGAIGLVRPIVLAGPDLPLPVAELARRDGVVHDRRPSNADRGG